MNRVLVIQGSPKGRSGNTEVLVQHFAEGCRAANAEAEIVYLAEKSIHHCCGCFSCWERTPGQCVFRDDMPELLDQMRQADFIVFATPPVLFHCNRADEGLYRPDAPAKPW